ncbi:hypothetical protein OESDEN_05453 [Oesophagostomum dentatum]|uniref:Ubiquitin-like domain-containing protein n=1 Tax=Oesophagostomum dentatum TaxID=61180 RepID=A0A0B1TAP6_OESDE|nr:hypothetical protein OESDEN_05453 [Oesophagostomum dentatum]
MRRFPNRKTVFLCENPIKSVVHDSSAESLGTLQSLNLGKTEIGDWDSIDSLDRLPSLTDLRILSIPLLEPLNEEERIHLVIGRVRNLRVLNGSIITPELREQSERYFIRYYQDRDDKPHHYKRLIDKHGHVERLAKVDLTPKSSAHVQVFCEETNYQAKLRINLNKNVEERIHLVIGRVRNLRVLNGSIITPELREQSERYFIRYYQDRDDKPHHYKRLIDKHGHVERLAKVDLTPKSSAHVQVFCEETNYQAKLRINLNKNVGQLMKSLEKECGIPYNRLRMFLTTKDGWVEEFRYPGMSLHSYRIEDGDVLNLQAACGSPALPPVWNRSLSTFKTGAPPLPGYEKPVQRYLA